MHGKVSCGDKSCIHHDDTTYDCKFIHIHPSSPYPGYQDMINDEGCDRYNKEPECGLCGDWGIYLENDKIHSCSCKNRKETMTLSFIGRDSSDRDVYDDGSGKLYVNANPRGEWITEICTKANNEFDREPCDAIPSDIEITFIPKRDRLSVFKERRELNRTRDNNQ